MIEETNLPDPDTIELSFPAIRVRQPIGDIFSAVIDANSIRKITYFDVRRVLRDERDIEKFLGVQRPLHEKRVSEIKDYVQFIDATFPTSIIISVENEYARFDEDKNIITITNTREGEKKPSIAISNTCRVLDGQHRIAGLEGVKEGHFDLMVSIFVGADISDQAYVFATVNLEQTKVNRSLAFDLYELARSRSPFKTCHNIAVALDRDDESPFYRRIKRLGVSTPGRSGETITQATFVNSLIPYLSKDPKADRDALMRGKKLPLISEDQSRKLIFRNMFIKEEDKKIGKIIEQYFLAVEQRWIHAWKTGGTGYILNRTNGFRALMSVFGDAYNFFAQPGQMVSKSDYLRLFNDVPFESDHFTSKNFSPGSTGESELRRLLREHMFEKRGRLI
ncbi:DGQHR domain-containing protein [Pyruvatibacter mobilis]|uniref:DGQHR domain-containing protein n=1 Tax=Pyruvatibacter mobilis TaxID=1712261 RepID=UPI003BAAE568